MKKVLACIIMSALTVSMFTGRGKKEVDYSLEVNSELSTESEEDNAGNLAQFRNQEPWSEILKVKDTSDKECEVRIEAEVIVPEFENIRVIESQPIAKDIEFQKLCLEQFFGADAEYYYHDEDHYTLEELEKWRWDDAERIEKASDTHTIATEFESIDDYAAYRNEILYEITLTDSNVGIYANWDDENKCGPEEFRNYKNIHTGADFQTNDENECKYSMDEAKAIADDYLKEVGLSAMECTLSEPLMWCGNNTDDPDDETANEYACYGYSFWYGTGIDGVSLAEAFPPSSQFSTGYESPELPNGFVSIWAGDPEEDQKDLFIGYGSAWITVTDVGVNSVFIDNAEVIETASNPVELLPLDTIKDVLKEEITKRTAAYDIFRDHEYNNLQLMYLKLKNDTEVNVSAVPAWCLSLEEDGSYEHPIFVNAISGTIIHFADTEWSSTIKVPAQHTEEE